MQKNDFSLHAFQFPALWELQLCTRIVPVRLSAEYRDSAVGVAQEDEPLMHQQHAGVFRALPRHIKEMLTEFILFTKFYHSSFLIKKKILAEKIIYQPPFV